MMKQFLKLSALVLSVSIIAGCSGGSGSAPTPTAPTPAPPTTAPAPDFSLTIGIGESKVSSSASLSLPAGTDSEGTLGASAGQLSIVFSELNGFEDTLSLTTTGVPAGVSFNPAVPTTLSPNVAQSMDVVVGLKTVPGNYAIVFTGEASVPPAGTTSVNNYPTTHSVTLNLTVTAEENFSLGLSQSSFSLPLNGVSVNTTLTLTPVNGFSSNDLTLTTSAPNVTGIVLELAPCTNGADTAPCPTGTVDAANNSIANWSGGPVTIMINEASPATIGTFPITFTATAPTGQSAAVTLTLTVTALPPVTTTPTYSISAGPGNIMLSNYSALTATTSLSVTNLTAGSTLVVTPSAMPANVTMAPNSLPAGVTASGSVLTFTTNATVVFTLTDNGNAATETSNLIYSAALSNGSDPTTTTPLNIEVVYVPGAPPAYFTFLLPGVSLVQGANAFTGTATVGVLGGSQGLGSLYTGPVAVALSGLPAGVTATPSQFTAIAGGPVIPVVITAPLTMSTGIYSITVTGTTAVETQSALPLLVFIPALAPSADGSY
jgi:hypothetical protein